MTTMFPLVLGGSTFGWTSDETESFAVLDAFRAAGGTMVDTADAYNHWVPGHGGGESETIIGRWLAARPGAADEVLVATKVGAAPARPGLRPENVVAAVDDSLGRLGVDALDLLYVHRDDPEVPLEEVVGVLEELLAAGKIRYTGLSNLAPGRIEQWMQIVEDTAGHDPLAIQPPYNLLRRAPFEQGVLGVCEDFDLDAYPYAALAGGFLTGSYRTEADLADRERGARVAPLLTPDGLGVVAALDEVAAAHGVTPAAVALAWTAARPQVVAPIASARTPGQLAELLASADLQLSSDETDLLDLASAPFA
jgi:aryl-alcohol dehydrogenase-like predicted oxidoreductase